MPRTTSYAYDLHGNLVQKTLPNGEKVAQSFDALNRVVTIEGQKPSGGGLLYRYAQRYDLAGNVVFIHEDYDQTPPSKWREITQEYDAAHRLVAEKYRHSAGGILGEPDSDRDVLYTYDAADNRTSKEIHYLSPDRESYTYNVLNQLTRLDASRPDRPSQTASSRTVDFGYDLNGNRILRGEDAATTGYEYDYDHRLVGVTTSTLQPTHAYTYDYRTRRVEIASDPGGGADITTTTLSFSGGTSVQEYTQLSTLNPQLSVEYIRGSDMGGGIGGILYSLRGGAASFTHYNARGDVVAKTDGGSTLTYQAAYEAYGTRSEETGSTLDPQKANTKDEDPTGLLNEGFRYRDLETGVFITRDPAGFVDGPNLYTYVRQNPWSHFDPEGLEGKTLDELRKQERISVSDAASANLKTKEAVSILKHYGYQVNTAETSAKNIKEGWPKGTLDKWRKEGSYKGMSDEQIFQTVADHQNLVEARRSLVAHETRGAFRVYTALLDLTVVAASIPFQVPSAASIPWLGKNLAARLGGDPNPNAAIRIGVASGPSIREGYDVGGSAMLMGSKYKVNIWGLYARSNESRGLGPLVQSYRGEAAEAGATRLEIIGTHVRNEQLLNPAIVARAARQNALSYRTVDDRAIFSTPITPAK